MIAPPSRRFDRGNENQGRGPNPRTIADMTLKEWLWIVLLTVALTAGLGLILSDGPLVVAERSACR